MRKVILTVSMTLDGCIARPDGAVDFLAMPKDYPMAEFFGSVDTAVMGRKTLDAARALTGGSFDMMGMKTYALSRSEPAGERDGLVFTRQSPKSLVASIRRRRGKNIWLMGGGETAREFLRADLVDELHLGVVPILLGEGLPLFPAGFPERKFALMDSHAYSGGLVGLRYWRVPKSRR